MAPMDLLCVDFINNAVQLFNAKLGLNNENMIKSASDISGLKITNVPCCNVTNTFICIPNQSPCPNRNDYVFWISVPSEASDVITTRRAYTALLPNATHPFDIRTLAAAQL
ncbi:hypothetical protein EZV62_024101 [Acer yangbiense]|uniref:Uncharacterized protein n=1 Tax=Acer yangbiense TaxID=1000413 RepID=A0A5C7H3U6_9ROSI|nr:hypothetical protein EZV62_024101 [Acer yangbiense]